MEFSEILGEVAKQVRTQGLSVVRGRGSVEDALVLPKVMRVSRPDELEMSELEMRFGELFEILAKVAKKVRTQRLSAVRGRGSVEDAFVLPKVMRVSLGVSPTIRSLANFLKMLPKSHKQ